jgi:hypothetical protein
VLIRAVMTALQLTPTRRHRPGASPAGASVASAAPASAAPASAAASAAGLDMKTQRDFVAAAGAGGAAGSAADSGWHDDRATHVSTVWGMSF